MHSAIDPHGRRSLACYYSMDVIVHDVFDSSPTLLLIDVCLSTVLALCLSSSLLS